VCSSDLKTDLGVPKSLGSAIPSAIILDTTLILDSPKQLIKAGIGDTISNYMALIDWEHASSIGEDEMNGFAYLMSKNALNALVKTQYDSICLEFVEVLANSIVMSGIAMYFAGSSRPVSGSEHLFSHALDYYCIQENLHGIQLALGTVSILKMLGYDYSKVLHYLNKFQVDINPVHLGISESDFILCMKKAPSMRHNRYTYLNEIDLSDKKLGRIYNELKEEL
jgi:glycerol-1-phosphate dehydrogenase [NAD(P)+]